MMENKNENNTPVQEELPTPKHKLSIEALIAGAFILGLSLVVFFILLITGLKAEDSYLIHFTYSNDRDLIFDSRFALFSLIAGVIISVVYFFGFYWIRPSGSKPHFKENLRFSMAMIILGFFGFLAYFVIAIFLSGLNISFSVSSLIAALLVGIYDYLIYKLYMEKRTLSNALFWEIFRFAIVGLVAAVFDFATCLLFQFFIFKGNTDWYVTGISTAMGFIVGVTINYLMSTYMVYKNAKSNFSKSAGGIISFLVLSAIGLGIGIGIQYLLYDLLNVSCRVSFLTYPVVFVIRTLVVMVYNYITRKVFIYR